MKPSLLVLVATLILLGLGLGGCGGRGPDTSLADAVGTDFAELTPEARQRLAGRLATVAGFNYDPATSGRSGPLQVVAHDDGFLLVWLHAQASGEDLELAAFGPGSELRWTAPLLFGNEAKVLAATVAAAGSSGPAILDLSLEGLSLGAPVQLLFAIGADGPQLIRSTSSAGDLANARLSAAHPDLALAPGDIAAKDRFQRLAATVHLAQPEQAALRGKPGVRSHLEQLAVGTDRWLAEAAAVILTLPTR